MSKSFWWAIGLGSIACVLLALLIGFAIEYTRLVKHPLLPLATARATCPDGSIAIFKNALVSSTDQSYTCAPTNGMRLNGNIMHQNTVIGPEKQPCTPSVVAGETTLQGIEDDGTAICITDKTNEFALVPISESAFMVWKRSNTNTDGKGYYYHGL